MFKFTEIKDESGAVTRIETPLRDKHLINCAAINKGSAFSNEERVALGLMGVLPDEVVTLEQQITRSYKHYQACSDDLAKNVFLNALHENNETLFYKLVSEHLEEMLPIVYTPTIGDAVEHFSYEFNLPRGIYFSYQHQDSIEAALDNRGFEDIDLIVVTDGEGVLGIGDWGIGGMDISIGKLMVYSLCGGINPRRVLPVQLDVGTNNEALLKDPNYLGWRHPRIEGQEYDAFIDKVVSAVTKRFPHIYFHWEDFGRDNARKNLERYRTTMCSFNDDMQGTGATALACLLSGLVATDQVLAEQNIVMLGAGTAGVGIVDQICNAMVQQGLPLEQARKRFWLVDRSGLLVDDMTDLVDFQRPYARSRDELSTWNCQDSTNISLAEVVKQAQATVLIGCSTVTGAFSEGIVKSMLDFTQHPIIMPLSNPTSHSEATPKDLIEWTDGRVLTATGSPFDPVEYQGKTIRISQSNNCFVFPGLGLGVIASKASQVSDGMIAAACRALSECSPARKDKQAPVLPDLCDVQAVSKSIALAVAEQARQEGLARVDKGVDFAKLIETIFWKPTYLPVLPV